MRSVMRETQFVGKAEYSWWYAMKLINIVQKGDKNENFT
jgi:hypothetical protein